MSELRDTFYQYPIPAVSAFPFEPILLVHRRPFNFIVDFLFEDSAGGKVSLPTIFDPGVPNSGGPGIP